jgi:hypothetical protein
MSFLPNAERTYFREEKYILDTLTFTRQIALIGAVVGAMLTFMSDPAQAELKWGYQYLPICAKGSPDRALCLRYIEGFLGGASMQAQASNSSLAHCLPELIPTEEIADAFYASIERGGALQVIKADGLLQLTLQQQWPCPGAS